MTAPQKPPTAGEIARLRAHVATCQRHKLASATVDTAQLVALLAALDAAEREPGPTLAKHQPCGCVVCTCDHRERCLRCGARLCDRHRAEPSSLWRDPGAVFEAHPLVARAEAAEARVAELERERDEALRKMRANADEMHESQRWARQAEKERDEARALARKLAAAAIESARRDRGAEIDLRDTDTIGGWGR